MEDTVSRLPVHFAALTEKVTMIEESTGRTRCKLKTVYRSISANAAYSDRR